MVAAYRDRYPCHYAYAHNDYLETQEMKFGCSLFGVQKNEKTKWVFLAAAQVGCCQLKT
jgi:hypothetical protein